MTTAPRFELTGPLPTGRAAIEASAGTGKTYTLAGLAVRYVAEAGVPIGELLVVTFTRAAAAELRDRVRRRLIEAAQALRAEGPPDDELFALLAAADRTMRAERLEAAVADFDSATITTIHGFAQQVLGTLGSTAPGDADAALVDDARELVSTVCADVVATAAIEAPADVGELPSRVQLSRLVFTALGNPGVVLVPGPEPEESTPASARWRRLVDRAVEEVHRRRRAGGTMSFDDILTQLRDALARSPAAAAALRRRYRVALIDEFQDTDPVQWRIFTTMFGDHANDTVLVLVGDPKQAIYAFRGANVHTYLEAAFEPGTDRSTLGTNWRSDGALLDAFGRVFTGATFGDPRIGFVAVDAPAEHAARRLTDRDGEPLPALALRTALDPGLKRTTRGLLETGAVEHAIAHDLARQVKSLLDTAVLPPADPDAASGPGATGRPVRPRDIAVLVGTHVEAAAMQLALRHQGVPAVAHRGVSVLESPAAVQWRWLLSGLARPSDPARARTAALSWFFGWTAERVDTATDDDLAEVQERLYAWAEILEVRGAVDFWDHVRAESGVTTRVLATCDGDRDLTDLDHLAQLLQARAAGHRPGPVGLLAALQLLDDAQKVDPENDVTARRIESEAESVQIMTVFAAKGLEFPVVCVPTLWRSSLANRAECIYQDPATGERTFDVAKAKVWPDKRTADARRELAAHESRGENLRLLYVALTRAQHHAIVWWTRASGSEVTGLARLLFARDETGALTDDAAGFDKVPLPDDADALALLRQTFAAAGDVVTVADIGAASADGTPWVDARATAPEPGELALATLGRVLERPHRRWSFSAISDRAHGPDLDPTDDTLGDAGAADERADEDERGEPAAVEAGAVEPGAGAGDGPGPAITGEASLGEDAGALEPEPASDLPLGRIAGGTDFGSMVHDLLEHVDFAAPDLDAELAARIDTRRRWNPVPELGDELAAGLRAAIETPLGPLFGGRRLRDIPRAHRRDELTFELRLGEGGRAATDRDLGRLVGDHLADDDPLRGWADRVAAGCFDVELAGHLTGSIDAVFRLPDPDDPGAPARYVLADYKTNVLSVAGGPPRASDYHPDRLPAAMEEHHYPLQALLYAVVLHRYLRWRVRGYDPAVHLGGAAYLFLRGMTGPDTPVVGGRPHGVFAWPMPPALVTDLSDLLDGRLVPT